MKIQITMKDPDGVYDAVMEAACQNLGGLDDDEVDTLIESRRTRIGDQLNRWVRFGEYVAIEIDLDAGTARVLEATK